jgi:hypothetical protein
MNEQLIKQYPALVSDWCCDCLLMLPTSVAIVAGLCSVAADERAAHQAAPKALLWLVLLSAQSGADQSSSYK